VPKMPFETKWYIKNQIVFVRAWGNLSIEDTQDFNHCLDQYIQEGVQEYVEMGISDGEVHFLQDGREIGSVPTSMTQLQKTLKVASNIGCGWIISISRPRSKVAFMINNLVMSVMQMQFKRVNTVEEAIAFLKDADPNINWDNADESVLPG
jgi:hypothetical protein